MPSRKNLSRALIADLFFPGSVILLVLVIGFAYIFLASKLDIEWGRKIVALFPSICFILDRLQRKRKLRYFGGVVVFI